MRVETLAGSVVELGTTEVSPTVGIVDYSRRVTDDFGVTTVVKRGFARRLSVRLALPLDSVDAVQAELASLRASSALWVADDRFEWLQVEGFFKDFELDLAVPPTSFCRLTVEGLAETEVVADPGGDPAPAGQTSTLRLLQPADGEPLITSSVPEADYPEWAAETSYAAGALVMKATTHRVYESVAANNVGNDPELSFDKWLDVGPTNRWAMFDQALGTATTSSDSMTVVVPAAPALALLDVTGSTVRVQATGFDQTQAVGTGSVSFLDLPPAAGNITVTISGTATVSVGTLLAGTVVSLGVTESAPSAGITDYSRKETDDFGEMTVVERAWAKRMTARALIRTDELDRVANRIAAVRGRPSLWIGDAGLSTLTVYGFFKEFSIEVGDTISKLSLSIEGLSTAGKTQPFRVPIAEEAINVGGVPATTVIADIRRNSETAIAGALGRYALQQFVTALTYLEGEQIGTVVVREIDERIEGDAAIVETIDLIGAKSGDGTAFVLSSSLVVAQPTNAQAVTLGTMVARVGTAEASIMTFTEARVVGGSTFVKAGFEADNNGVVTGIYFTADGTTAALKMTLDQLTIYRPGTNTAAPTSNDLLFSLDGTKLRLRDVVVDSIEIASVGPTELATGATGEGALFFDANGVNVSSQSVWTNIAAVSITSIHGKPIKIDFTMFAQNISDSNTYIRLRVIRDDGTAIYGGSAGREIAVQSKGSALSFRCIDSPIKDRANTYTLQGMKAQSNDVVSFAERVVMAEEQSRINFQNYTVVSAEAGTGPGGGIGGGGGTGGGGTYDPNPDAQLD